MYKNYLRRSIFIWLCLTLLSINIFAESKNNINKGTDMPVFHIGTLHAKPEALGALIESLSMVSKQKGCISHKIFIDTENPNMIISYEEWERREDHENFISSFSEEEMNAWIDMLTKAPEGSFFNEI